MSEPRTITLTLRAWVAVAVVVVLGLLIFAAQLTFIVEQRGIVDDQRHIAVRQEDRSRPVLETAGALLGSPKDALAAARDAGETLTELRRVLRTVLDEDVVGVTGRALRRAPELLSAVDHAVAVLDRTYPTLRESLGVQHQTLAILRESLSLQRETRDRATETRDLTTQLLQVAQATLSHAESIDRKTGGQLPQQP